MCFLYRQSISIVYESKFKYIYRYFIKIDRCFCGILQSLPLRKCGLKFRLLTPSFTGQPVTSLAEVWIEINVNFAFAFKYTSLPLRKCGLKLSTCTGAISVHRHFPCGSVDWNFCHAVRKCQHQCHFPCGSVDWNPWSFAHFGRAPGHFPCGSVDWNSDLIPYIP